MYRRYEPPKRQQGQMQQSKSNNYGQPNNKSPSAVNGQRNGVNANSRNSVHKNQNTSEKTEKNREEKKQKRIKNGSDLLTGFIPKSIYNPDTRKVLGFLTAEDLLLAALILLLIDESDEESDNSILIYALLYILIEGHVDLPF